MTLITCPDCGTSISDQSPACIHCGRPTPRSSESAQAQSAPATPQPTPAAPVMPITTPVHEWQGKLYIGITYLGAAFAAFGLLLMLFFAVTETGAQVRVSEVVIVMLVFSLLIGLPFAIARGVSQFKNWSWYTTMAVIPISTIGYLADAFSSSGTEGPAQAIAVIITMLSMVWLRYFWDRRADFGVR